MDVCTLRGKVGKGLEVFRKAMAGHIAAEVELLHDELQA